jgi:plasmid rolling circle replication initiator protein Rep
VIHADFKPNEGSIYLTDLSPRDAKWKELKPQNIAVANDYAGTHYDKYYDRMSECSGYLRFALVPTEEGESVHKLQAAHFCRVRHCPICQWRRSLMWRSRTIRAVNRILADYPGKRFIYVTLTVRNCQLEDLGATIAHMNESWHRLIKRPQFKAVGWLRNLEVTRGSDGSAHPHFHALLMVNPGYFAQNYLNQKNWIALWRSCARLDYDPSVRVNVVKPKKKSNTDTSESSSGIDEGLLKAIRYTLKYSNKPEDILNTDTSECQDMQAWLIGLTDQLHNKRAIASGGIFKKYLAESDPTNLIVDEESIDTSDTSQEDPKISYFWREPDLDYALVS